MRSGAASLLPSMAAALVELGRRLDQQSLPNGPLYTIPKLDVDMRFGLQMQKQNWAVLFRGAKRHWQQHQRLRCSFTSEPVAQDRLAARLQWTVAAPHYLPGRDAEERIAREAAAHLEEGRCRYRGVTLVEPGEVRAEAERIRASMVNVVDGCGMVVMRVAPDEYVIVRVADQARNDGVFLYNPHAAVPVDIFRMENDREETVLVEPLARLLAAIRDTGVHASPFAGIPELRWGWEGLNRLIDDLLAGYEGAIAMFAESGEAGYHVHGFESELVYSSWSRGMGALAADPFDAADEWIHNRVRITVSAPPGRCTVELVSPEFVLDGSARDLLIAQAVEAAGRIERAFPSRDCAAAIRDPRTHTGVVAVLSYQEKPPDQGFVVVWPAHGRDLVFSCASDGVRITDVEPVLGREQSAAEVVLHDRHFQAIHKFFRAIRLWQTRVALA